MLLPYVTRSISAALSSDATIVEVKPTTLAAGSTAYYKNPETGKVEIEYVGNSKGEAVIVVEYTGIPADGSVTLAKIATAALASIMAPWRRRLSVGGEVTTAAAAGTKYLLFGNTANASEPEAKSASAGVPYLIRWAAADEAVAGLITKVKIRAKSFVGTAAKVTVHVGLYKIVPGAKLTLGEEVGAGFNIELGETANTGVAGESAEFTISEDTDYAVGITVSGTPAQNLSVQAALLVHNVAA